jgi:iron complex outermembrane receptor protein
VNYQKLIIMRKQVFTGLLCMIAAMQLSGQHMLTGKVVNTENEPITGANVYLERMNVGTITNASGHFTLDNLPPGSYQISFSFVGYGTKKETVYLNKDTDLGTVVLEPSPYMGEEVTISALRAGKKTPMAYVNIDREEIAERNFGQDIPYIVSLTPSLITSSDAGNGIGYTSMRIRGTDANRINVTINGIPLNDAESHGVFWVDLPDLASSTEQIQIQRGVGTSTNGAAAFGATVNMQTSLLNKEPYDGYDLTVGSFNTIKNTVSAGTGLINNHFALDFRLSDLHSDGYIDRSWTDLQSYYLSAGWYAEKSSLKFITFGGFEELYQSWGGVPSYLLSSDRTFNEMGAYTDTSGRTAYYDNQVDHYDQVHYQLHYSRKLTTNLHLNAALHYTWGNGYYEQYEEGQDFEFYSMEPAITGNDTIITTDLVRRKWLDNDFYGAIASLTYERENASMILGGGWNKYDGLHFGKVIWAQYMGNNKPGHQWYKGVGIKTDWNVYGKYYQDMGSGLTGFLDLQLRGVTHDISGTDAENRVVTQDHRYLFFNPKAGLNYIPAPGQRAFFSYARASREPNRNNYTDAPQDRVPVPETLNDFEAGYSYGQGPFRAAITMYYMDYEDQLVLTGQINEVGYPVMTNVAESYRAGIELEAGYNFRDKIILKGTAAFSQNRIRDFVNYVDNWDYWSDPESEPYQVEEYIGNSTLAYSPSVVTSGQVKYRPMQGLSFSILSKYVSRQYIDNTETAQYSIDPYFVNNLRATYSLYPDWAGELGFSVLVANVLDTRYETNAWLYRYYYEGEEMYMDGYYPQAGRHVMLAMKIKF